MTFEQIEALDIEDYREEMVHRLNAKLDEVPEEPVEWTEETISQEFEAYKGELVKTEEDRLKKIELQERFEALVDPMLCIHSLHPQVTNPKVFIKEMLTGDLVEAETTISDLEMKYSEMKTVNQVKKGKRDKIKNREAAILGAGYNRDMIIEALYRAVVKNDFTMVDAMKEDLDVIDQEHPLGE